MTATHPQRPGWARPATFYFRRAGERLADSRRRALNRLPLGDTLFLPQKSRTSSARDSTLGLPTDLLSQSAARLRVLALLYASVYFLAGFFPRLLFPVPRALLFSNFIMWGPGTIAISVALAVALVTRSTRVPLPIVMTIGLGFEIASSYAIAVAEFLNATALNVNIRWLGLSWVAVWTLLFNVVVPTSPRRALVAALASVSSVPVVIGLAIATNATSFRPSPDQFFFWLVFPYLLIVVHGLRRPRASSTAWARKSAAPANWEAIGWRSGWDREAWAKSGAPSTACWRGPPRSS